MATYDDILGGLPPAASALTWPWDAPPVAPDVVAPPVAPPPAPDPAPAPPVDAPLVGPPELAAVGSAPPAPLPLPAPAPAPPVLEPYGAAPPVLGPPAPKLRDILDVTIDQPAPAAPPRDPSEPDADRTRALSELAQRDPAAFAEVQIRHEADRAKVADARRSKLISEDWDRQTSNFAIRQEATKATRTKMAALLADAKRLGGQEIDPSGGVRGVRHVAGIVSSIVGGLIQGRTGSTTNSGIDALSQAIDRGIKVQQMDLANRREGLGMRRTLLADEMAAHEDEFRAAEALRLAAYKHAEDLLSIEQQNYERGGTTEIRIAAAKAEVIARKQEQAQKVEALMLERELKLAKDARDAAQLREEMRKNRATEALAWAKEGRERASAKAEDVFLTPQQIREQFPDFPAAAIPPQGATIGQLSKRAELANKSGLVAKTAEETRKAARENDPNERNIERAVPGVVDDKGQLVHFADKTIAGDVATAKESVDETVRLTDSLISMIKKNGWSSDFVKSKEWRAARQNFNEILIRKKETDKLGVLTGPDVGIVTGEIGTDDPTEARGDQAVAALQHFRRNQVEAFNAKIRNRAVLPDGRKIARWEPPSLDLPESGPSPDQELVARLKAKPRGDVDEVRGAAVHDFLAEHPEYPRNASGQVEWTPEVSAAARAAADAAVEDRKNISPQQRRDIAALAKRAAAGDKLAVEHLQDVAKTARTPRVRAVAESALTAALRPPTGPDPAAVPSDAEEELARRARERFSAPAPTTPTILEPAPDPGDPDVIRRMLGWPTRGQ